MNLSALTSGEVAALCSNVRALRSAGVTYVKMGDLEMHLLPIGEQDMRLTLEHLERMPLEPGEDAGERMLSAEALRAEYEKKCREEAEAIEYGAG